MNSYLDELKAATVGSSLVRDLARMSEYKSSWHEALAQSGAIAKQFTDVMYAGSTYGANDSAVAQLKNAAHVNSAYVEMEKIKNLIGSTMSTVGEEYKKLMGVGSTLGQAASALRDYQRAEKEALRKVLDPLADIRKSFMLDVSTQDLVKEMTRGLSVGAHSKDMFANLTGAGSAAKVWAQQVAESESQTKKLFDELSLGSTVQSWLKDFEQTDKRWMVSNEVLGVVGSLQELQRQIGKVALPTIDWGSATALAKLLGEDGLEGQLAHLGIRPDGSLHVSPEAPEKGLLSRKQSDTLALLGLLLSILSIWMSIQMFVYQESSGAVQQAKNDEQSAKQLRQLESLTRLVEQTLVKAAKQEEERFVVRERAATVRSQPKNGAAVDGKLMPNEIVRGIDKEGKWVEVEYYHWLHEEYRTGWILKKYLERVPANHIKQSADI